MITMTFDCDPSLIAPNRECVQILIEDILAEKGIEYAQLSYIFCNDVYLSRLKKKFFKKNHLTDVIAFRLNSYEEKKVEGEVYISLQRAKENAKKYKEPYKREVGRLIIHGCLHLLGYLDETKKQKQIMDNLENVFLDKMLWAKLF